MTKKNINVPELKDFNLKSFKRMNGGGATIIFSFMFSAGNEVHTFEGNDSITLNIHDDLLALLDKQKPNILTMDGVKYRIIATTLEKMDNNNQKEVGNVSQIAEGLMIETMKKITVTGIKLSGKDKNRKAVLTYTHLDENEKIVGRATSAILLGGNKLGFEEELEFDIASIEHEVYAYLFGDKHSDSAQLQIPYEDQETKDIISETEPVIKEPEKPKKKSK